MLVYLLLLSVLVQTGWTQTRDTVITNTDGYKMDRAPTFLVVAPKRIRPSMVIQVFVTILRLEYQQVNVKISVVEGKVMYAGSELMFDRPGSRIMQMRMPGNAQEGNYILRVEGSEYGSNSGNIFFNETRLEFSPKQASLLIQLSKPIYRQSQTVHFRVVPILPNLMPKYGSMTIYVHDPTGFPVRRWLAVQTNAGGLVSQSFELSDQPNYGNWSIVVDAFGTRYNQYFLVEEYWDPRFDVNVTVKPYIMDNQRTIGGIVNANFTTGRPTEGNGTVVVSVYPPSSLCYQNPTVYYNKSEITPVMLRQVYPYVKGPIFFEFNMEEIRREVRRFYPQCVTLEDFELQFNVSIYDWFFMMTEEGYASTVIFSSRIRLQWVGDIVRTFKPDSTLSIQVAAMHYDGTAVKSAKPIHFTVNPISGATGAVASPAPVTPTNGIAEINIAITDNGITGLDIFARYNNEQNTEIQMKTTRYYSPSNSYITVSTSTKNPSANEYMIFHVRTTNYIPRIYYQVIAQGNIIIGEELEMISRRKSFAIALSREMVPTARLVVYYVSGQPEEIVMDSISFYVSGLRANPVKAEVNLGKDFTRDSVEIRGESDPGSYMAFSAMPLDIYSRGINDGLTEYRLIDELNSYDGDNRRAWQHLWRLSETEFEYKFFTSTGHGVDTTTTLSQSGLVALSDVTITRVVNPCNFTRDGMLPCFTGELCYSVNKTCDGIPQCSDWADEQNCPVEDPRYNNRTEGMIHRVSRVLRFYEDSAWAWKEYFTKPDRKVQFRVNPPKYPLTWMINGIAVSRSLGLGVMSSPIRYDASRFMYMIVEAPDIVVRGEHVGVRVTVFNYWPGDNFIEVLVTMKGSKYYDSLLVGDEGYVDSRNPLRHPGDHQTIVFLEPGTSKDIFMPIMPNIVMGSFNISLECWSFMDRDFFHKTIYVKADGVENYYHTPYLIDLIRYSSIKIPELKVNVSDKFIEPEVREHLYVPGSEKAVLTCFGDVVTPGFFTQFPTAEDIMRRPYGGGEMNMFNFAYNLITLKFKKNNQQLPNDILRRTLGYMNIALQRQLSYMNDDGSFSMFRDDESPSIWLTAFVAKTFQDARFGEWEKDMFIPIELLNKIALYLCSQQNNVTGEFMEEKAPIYDRTYGHLKEMKTQILMGHPVPLTSYVLIALKKLKDASGDAQSCITKAANRASEYLSKRATEIAESKEVFHIAISAYALSLTGKNSQTLYNELMSQKRSGKETYFADDVVRDNPSTFINTVRYLLPRLPLVNDGYAVQTTAYALLAYMNHEKDQQASGVKQERDSMMRWLQFMRNYFGAFASTQDTLVAMEALSEFTRIDPNRNVFNMQIQLQSSATHGWMKYLYLLKDNYTNLEQASIPNVYGQASVTALGIGRAMLQLTTTVNVEWEEKVRETVDFQTFYDLYLDDEPKFSGRNNSILTLHPCVSWVYQTRSKQAGLSVLEIDVPSGYVVMNHTLRNIVRQGVPANLKRAEYYARKVVLYFSYLDNSKTCVKFDAYRWYPVANMTIQNRMRVYDYYEPGMHRTRFYTTYDLFNLNICYVCGSYQCPYCPFFNVATVIKATFTTITLFLGFIVKHYLSRVT
ncbi:CD109 antigen-like [Mytilus californianus]|uniref:CD109 antigen-like n=1 Tax=Mytilus californianus TaxID=6549 RepID=UPI002245EFBC|nr:CD109 antigen-like [Mytilus californianus]